MYYSAPIRLSQPFDIQNDGSETREMTQATAGDLLRTDFSLLIDGELTTGNGNLDVIDIIPVPYRFN